MGCSTINTSDWQAVGLQAIWFYLSIRVVSKLGTTPGRGTGLILEVAILFLPGWLARRKSHGFTSAQGILRRVVHLPWEPRTRWFHGTW